MSNDSADCVVNELSVLADRTSVKAEEKTRVLVVYFSLTQQTRRVAVEIGDAFESRGCTAVLAQIAFTDDRWLPRLNRFPMSRPISTLASILPAQLRRATGEIEIPAGAGVPGYDLIVLMSPTWWFQTSMPMRSYLQAPEARAVLTGKPFACVSVSRRYYSVNLRQQKRLGKRIGGRCVGNLHFVAAGGQVRSMLSWISYMRHGEPQARVFGLTMPPPNLQPHYSSEVANFVGTLVEQVLARRGEPARE